GRGAGGRARPGDATGGASHPGDRPGGAGGRRSAGTCRPRGRRRSGADGMRFGLIWSEAFSGLRRNASMVISVVLVTFVSLTFVGAAMLMQMQIGTMRAFWQDRAQVQIYLCASGSTAATCTAGAATDEQIQAVEAKLESPALSPLIKEIRFQTSEEAYQDLVDLLGEDEASFLTPEQVSATFWVRLVDPTEADAIVE